MTKINTNKLFFKRAYRFVLWSRKLFSKKKCRAFDLLGSESGVKSISQIYVINLDRQLLRWEKVTRELSLVLNGSGDQLTMCTTRVSAVDALEFENTVNTKAVDHTYTLGEQLFVDPRRTLPKRLNLDEEIQMSRQEIAVALSHIKIWKKIATGSDQYALVLEDDVCFMPGFSVYVDKIWGELCKFCKDSPLFDILYLSYNEVDQGAEKIRVTQNTSKLFRGIWYLSGYVLSKRGAKKLLNQLPVRGPVDLWINHKFDQLEALVASKSVIAQRADEKSQNFYSVLSVLSKIGVLNSETPGIFQSALLAKPVFVVGGANTGLTSLAMALSMLGYRCCSDLDELPDNERKGLLCKDGSAKFNAYVNVGCIDSHLTVLAKLYPESKLILISDNLTKNYIDNATRNWSDRFLILSSQTNTKWKQLCEFLEIVPPACSYPKLEELARRKISQAKNIHQGKSSSSHMWMEADSSPWVMDIEKGWNGVPTEPLLYEKKWPQIISDSFNNLDDMSWLLRCDTFPGNLALFSSLNFSIANGSLAQITVRHEDMEVRQYSSAALTSKDEYLFGRFEAVIKPPKVEGLITGFFLHRDSPRQEIDIEFLGKDPCKILINVYYNPGCDGARFDYGYRGTPILVDLGFDATSDFHTYAIEWEPDEIRWYVDGELIHKRSNWEPTPIPHLPMKFHINIWPSMSHELAGRVDKKLLPASAQIQFIRLSAISYKYNKNLGTQSGAETEKTVMVSIVEPF